MNKTKVLIDSFNQPDSLLILSSFPGKREEIAWENAVSRYTYLLVKHFPKNQKAVVFCEKKKERNPYQLASNILVVPSYKVNSPLFFWQVNKQLSKFSQASNLLIQFEFSIFGGKGSLPGLLGVLACQRLFGRNIVLMFHQVVSDLNVLSDHLGLGKNGLLVKLYTVSLRVFYTLSGLLIDTSLVHDEALKTVLSKFINPGKIEIIPHGTEKYISVSEKEKEQYRTFLGLIPEEKVVLAFGYHSWYKGTDWIVKAFSAISENNVRLVLGGGESPTLKNTNAYKKYAKKLHEVIKRADGKILATGFIPESDVKKIFSISDVVVFPYRTKMSASGALALAWGYGKPVLVSNQFAKNFQDTDISDSFKENKIDGKKISFSLSSKKQFRYRLANIFRDEELKQKLELAGSQISRQRSWGSVASKYLLVCTQKAVALSPSVREDEVVYAFK